jgi:VWFA-related protein
VAQGIARTLIQKWLGPGDLIGVRQLGSDSDETVLRDSVPAALTAIATFHVRPQTSLHEQEEIERARQLTDTLRDIGRAMRLLSDRRVSIVLLSEGISYDFFNVQALGSSDITQGMQSALATLRMANVVLYAIDPRGLTSTEGTAVETGAAGGSVEAALGAAANGLRVGQISLEQLAEETGGFASVNDNRFDAAIDRIGHEMSNYYMLGFAPRDKQCDGVARRLRVKVRVPGSHVQARSSYACGAGQAGR